MKIWAIGDLHLSFGVANKSMAIFGPQWREHARTIEESWKATVGPDDLVLVPGDISWALKLEDALADLHWIDRLPGTKVLLKGNHDYWWGSLKKVSAVLPPSLHLIQNNAFSWKSAVIGGTRLWDTSQYHFGEYLAQAPISRDSDKETQAQKDLGKKIFERECQRLEISLASLPSEAKIRIAMTHYPPIGADLQPSVTSQLLEKYRIDICVFGHLHGIKEGLALFGIKNNVRYVLASSDYLRFSPVFLATVL
jgi:predicted phosphohydrolase